jgi:hypothetical protein
MGSMRELFGERILRNELRALKPMNSNKSVAPSPSPPRSGGEGRGEVVLIRIFSESLHDLFPPFVERSGVRGYRLIFNGVVFVILFTKQLAELPTVGITPYPYRSRNFLHAGFVRLKCETVSHFSTSYSRGVYEPLLSVLYFRRKPYRKFFH